VSDDGPGLSAPIPALSRPRGSRGRGLAIVGEIARRAGGALHAAPSARGARAGHRAPGLVVSRRRRAFALAGSRSCSARSPARTSPGAKPRSSAGSGRRSRSSSPAPTCLPAASSARRTLRSGTSRPAYAPAASFSDPSQAAGLRTTGAVVHGTDLVPALLAEGEGADGAALRPGERIADLVASGPPKLVRRAGASTSS
jgi:hypothetical protein